MSTVRSSNTRPPHRAILYSGHMVDAPNRNKPRFPPSLERAVAAAIAHEAETLHLTDIDAAIGGAACGSDILVAEELLRRGVGLTLFLPFHIDTFIRKSVAFVGGNWEARFLAIRERARIQIATDVLGDLSPGSDPYARTNAWMLEEAERAANGNVVLICVWDGDGGDGPGGTAHMVEIVGRRGGDVHWIDIRNL